MLRAVNTGTGRGRTRAPVAEIGSTLAMVPLELARD